VIPRFALFASVALLAACSPTQPAVQSAKQDPTQEKWYGQTVDQLTAINRQAEGAFAGGKFDEASNLILKGQPLENRLMDVSRPTQAAAEAASDLDQLYGRMLLTNKNYGWARLEFQKNRARWKNWRPQTAETARRLKLADDAIAECDRRMEE
jgi:hypothetical protein